MGHRMGWILIDLIFFTWRWIAPFFKFRLRPSSSCGEWRMTAVISSRETRAVIIPELDPNPDSELGCFLTFFNSNSNSEYSAGSESGSESGFGIEAFFLIFSSPNSDSESGKKRNYNSSKRDSLAVVELGKWADSRFKFVITIQNHHTLLEQDKICRNLRDTIRDNTRGISNKCKRHL